jgi:hypothetical protein
MTTVRTVSFQKTVLASLIGFCISQSAFALQELSDDGLSQTTGEELHYYHKILILCSVVRVLMKLRLIF